MLLVLNSFMKKRLTTKSSELQSETRRGHASRPYNSTARYLVRISSKVTSSDARRSEFRFNLIANA